jgi:hypothetical protein
MKAKRVKLRILYVLGKRNYLGGARFTRTKMVGYSIITETLTIFLCQ